MDDPRHATDKPTAVSDTIQALGSTIRMARMARHVSQLRTAREAGVSRAQLAALENGRNVSVRILVKIAAVLGLEVRVATTGTQRANIDHLLRSLDVLAVFVDEIRAAAVNSILPPSERVELQNTSAVREFLARHSIETSELARLSEAILADAHEVLSLPPASAGLPDAADAEPAARHRRARRRA